VHPIKLCNFDAFLGHNAGGYCAISAPHNR
ncbi:MAG: hypothetical protein ACJA1L_003131, partial [Paracoccaceae bacterium]